MRILGLDPGSIHTGYGVVQALRGRLTALAVGRISCPRSKALAERLGQLSSETTELLAQWQPDVVVIETPFRGINVRSLISLAEARGALLAAAALSGARLAEYSPAEVKAAVTGSGRAEKEQVARMVRVLLGLDCQALPFDATDALAVAICCAQRFRMDEIASGKVTTPQTVAAPSNT
jgi:crossover junction endodeoxyribonuclease RuvC